MGKRPRVNYSVEQIVVRNKLWLELERERIEWFKIWRRRKRDLEKAIKWYYRFVEDKKDGYVGSKIRVRNFLCTLEEFNITKHPFYAIVTPLKDTRNIGAGPGNTLKKYFISKHADNPDSDK